MLPFLVRVPLLVVILSTASFRAWMEMQEDIGIYVGIMGYDVWRSGNVAYIFWHQYIRRFHSQIEAHCFLS